MSSENKYLNDQYKSFFEDSLDKIFSKEYFWDPLRGTVSIH